MNKKGQFDPRLIIVVFVVIILLGALSSIIPQIACQNEREQISDLTSRLASCQGQNVELSEQIQKNENLSNQLDLCLSQLAEANSKLQECSNFKETFPLFYIENIYLTKTSIFILNLSLVISIGFTIRFVIKIVNKKH